MKRWFTRYVDDLLLVLGCILILFGLAQWNGIVTWIAAGGMLIVFGVLIAKAKAQSVIAKPIDQQQPED